MTEAQQKALEEINRILAENNLVMEVQQVITVKPKPSKFEIPINKNFNEKHKV